MHKTVGNVALTNISQKTLFAKLYAVSKIKILSLSAASSLFRMFLHFGRFSNSRSHKNSKVVNI